MLTLKSLVSSAMTAPKQPSTPMPAEAIAMQDMSSSASLSVRESLDEGPLCPITLEPIKSYRPEEVFTTLGGKSYHLSALKIWLQDHNTLPHNQQDASAEVVRIWPKAALPPLKTPFAVKVGLGAVAGGSLISSVGTFLQSLPFIALGQSIPVIAQARCGEALLYKRFDSCVEQAILALETQASQQAAVLRPVAGALLGLSVCMVGANAYLIYKDRAAAAKFANVRTISPEEREQFALDAV